MRKDVAEDAVGRVVHHVLSRGRAYADERLRFGELLEVLAADEAGVHVPLRI